MIYHYLSRHQANSFTIYIWHSFSNNKHGGYQKRCWLTCQQRCLIKRSQSQYDTLLDNEPANPLTLTHLVSTSKHWFPEPEETNNAKEESKNQAPDHFFVRALNTCSTQVPVRKRPYLPDNPLSYLLPSANVSLLLSIHCSSRLRASSEFSTRGGGDCMSATYRDILFTWKWWYTSFQTPYHQLLFHEYDETLNVCLEYLPQRTLLLATDQIQWVSVIAAHCSIYAQDTQSDAAHPIHLASFDDLHYDACWGYNRITNNVCKLEKVEVLWPLSWDLDQACQCRSQPTCLCHSVFDHFEWDGYSCR